MHYHHRKRIIWRTFLAFRKTFQAGGRYKTTTPVSLDALEPIFSSQLANLLSIWDSALQHETGKHEISLHPMPAWTTCRSTCHPSRQGQGWVEELYTRSLQSQRSGLVPLVSNHAETSENDRQDLRSPDQILEEPELLKLKRILVALFRRLRRPFGMHKYHWRRKRYLINSQRI